MILIYPPLDTLKEILARQQAPGHGISWKWGRRVHPVTGEIGSYHDGIDLGAPSGTPIRSIADGIVGGMGDATGGGKWLRILHDGYIYPIAQSGHCHLSEYSQGLEIGSEVTRGQIIAFVGNTGMSTGAHLHFQLWCRTADGHMADVDPLPLLEICVAEQPIPVGGIA